MFNYFFILNIKIKDIMQFKLLEDLDFTKRGGLLPVIVQDQLTKDILMLAY